MNDTKALTVTSSPQFYDRASTANIMWTVSLCLLPACAWGVYVFGKQAFWVLLASVAAAVAAELVIARVFFRRLTIRDGSAFLTGLLVGMNMPPAVPIHIPVVASLFAIAVVKWTFGGLGTNWMNPALAGRVFVFFSWTGPMTRWSNPVTFQAADAVSAATPLGFVKTGLLDFTGGAAGPAEFLAANGFPRSLLDGTVTTWLNVNLLGPLGLHLPQGYVDLFIGSVPGSIGEVSALFLLLGTVHLFARRIITWEIPVSYLGVFGVLIWALSGYRFGGGFGSGDVLFHLFSGGLILGAFYMATDMVTSPLTPGGMLVYGAGAGFITFLIRIYGSFPEGVSLAILIMNIFVPLINRYTGPRRFGLVKNKGGQA